MLGEAIPFMLQRMDRTLSQQMTKLARPVSDYLRQNVHYTFGGFNFTPTFLNLLLEIGVERIMFSVDYPYGSMREKWAMQPPSNSYHLGAGEHEASCLNQTCVQRTGRGTDRRAKLAECQRGINADDLRQH